jgi:DNA-binding transcriptional LysR family regulator
MELSQLRIFQAVAEEGSIAKAALRMNRVPSNLSTRLRQLEDSLGVELFLRERQRLQLSGPGKILQSYAERLFALHAEAEAALRGGEPCGDFVIGSMFSTAAIHLPAMLARYHRAYPEVNLQVQTMTSGDLVEGLIDGRLGAALVDGPLDYSELDGIELLEEQMVLITAAGHAPVRCARDVAGEAVYTFRSRCAYRRRLEGWYAASRAPMGRVMEIESYHSMLACVIAGGGVAMMSRSMLDSMPGREGVDVHALAAPFDTSSTWLMWRKDMLGPNLRAWVALQESASALTAVPSAGLAVASSSAA